MPTVKVRNLSNKEVGDVTLSDAVFGAELNEALIHAAVKIIWLTSVRNERDKNSR